MTQIAISDEVASTLASAASERGCTQDDLANMLIAEGLHHEGELQLTPDQEARLLESIRQAKRGEFVDGEVVMARFDADLKAMEGRLYTPRRSRHKRTHSLSSGPATNPCIANRKADSASHRQHRGLSKPCTS